MCMIISQTGIRYRIRKCRGNLIIISLLRDLKIFRDLTILRDLIILRNLTIARVGRKSNQEELILERHQLSKVLNSKAREALTAQFNLNQVICNILNPQETSSL